MYQPRDIASLISTAQREAAVESEVRKVRRNEDVVTPGEPVTVHSCQFDQERMASLERQVEEMADAFAGVSSALSVFNEELAKAQGMLKYCYAICQNPGIKDLADANRDRAARGPLANFSFGKYGANRDRNSDSGPGPAPRSGLGSAARP